MNSIKQFDIYLLGLSPTKGAEQKGVRPCVILQTNAVSEVSRTFLVGPISSKLSKSYPFQVPVVSSKENGLLKDSKIKLDQIRVIDRVRLIKRLGTLEKTYHPAISQAIDIMIDRFGDFSS